MAVLVHCSCEIYLLLHSQLSLLYLARIKAHELRGKSKEELTTQLKTLKVSIRCICSLTFVVL